MKNSNAETEKPLNIKERLVINCMEESLLRPWWILF